MDQSDIALLYEYNYWANRRLLTAASRLSVDRFTVPTAFPRGSLRGTLVHILDAEYGWRTLLQDGREAEDLSPDGFPTVASLTLHWERDEAAMRAYIAGLSDQDMARVLRYTNPQGLKRERVVWHCLVHVVNHGTQHRSEAAAMLTDFGQSPGDVDFSIFSLHAAKPIA